MKGQKKIAIIGFGAGGYCAADEIRRRDPEAEIDVFSDTDLAPYNPMLTTYYVKGAIHYDALFPFGSLEEIISRLRLNFFAKTPVVALDAGSKRVTLIDGTQRFYDSIVIATGASAFVPPISGRDLPGVFKMRTVDDAVALKKLLDSETLHSVLVVGASWVGIKVAEDVVERGLHCTLADGAKWIFPVAAFEQTAERIHADLRKKGVNLVFEQMLSRIEKESNGQISAVMQNGTRLTADAIAMCIGIRSNTSFLKDSGIELGRAIRVDQFMRTNVEGIYAVGDCCEAPETQSGTTKNIGVWINAQTQGRIAGSHICGGSERLGANILLNLAHYLHYDFLSIGDISLCRPEDQVYEFENEQYYIRAVRDADCVKCINMIGTAECNGIFKNLFIKALENDKAPIDPKVLAMLAVNEIPISFIEFLGWQY